MIVRLIDIEMLLQWGKLIYFHYILNIVQEWNDAFRYDGDYLLLEVVWQGAKLDESHWSVDLGNILDENRIKPEFVPLVLLDSDPVYNLCSLLESILQEEPLHAIW